MDLGVGSFVFSAGVVSAKAILKDRHTARKTTLARRLYASARHSLPLLVLGLGRLWSVKGLDYAEHVSEYGVHWNFFFTLAFIPPFVALFQSFFTIIPSYALLSLLLSGTYQILLETTSLKAYVLTAPRTTLLAQNREGIFSFIGYLSIFLSGQATGIYVLPRNLLPPTRLPNHQATAPTPRQQRITLLTRLATWSAIWTTLFVLSTSYTYGPLALPISRRLANLPYHLWVTAFNTIQLTLFCVIETVFFPAVHNRDNNSGLDKVAESYEAHKATSRILHAYNRNGLAVFLVANLLTGVVNLSVGTLEMGRVGAMGVLGAYAVVVTGVAVGLDVGGWIVKF